MQQTNSALSPEALRAWRIERGWTQERAAEWYGIAPRTWRRWEQGDSPIPLHVERRLRAGEGAAALLGRPAEPEEEA